MKRVFAMALCLVMLLALAIPVGAAQQNTFLHPFTKVSGATLYLTGAPADGTITVAVNGQSFEHYSISTIQDAGVPVTYYCIVDQASSFSVSQKKLRIQALTALDNAMRSMDSMVLVSMGSTLSFSEPLTDPEARKQAIEEACSKNIWRTNLNDFIITAVETAAKSQNHDSLNCVILFTDGLDSVENGTSSSAVASAIQSSGLSVNALALTDSWADQQSKAAAQKLEAYASQSIGGKGLAPTLETPETTAADAISEIVNNVLRSSVIMIDTDLLPREQDTLTLEVSLELNGKQQAADSLSLDTALLPPLPEPTEPETTAPETTEPATFAPPTTVPETTVPPVTRPQAARTGGSSGSRTVLIALICVGAAAILAVLLIVARRSKKSQEEDKEPDFTEDESPLIPQNTPATDIQLDFSSLRVPTVKSKPIARPELELPVTVSSCKVRLMPMGQLEGAVEFSIKANESVTLGRTGKADIILNETDTALSGLHFELQWDSRVLHLRDRKSTNGTALNGIPLKAEAWTRVENNAVIQAGAGSYTVFVDKK